MSRITPEKAKIIIRKIFITEINPRRGRVHGFESKIVFTLGKPKV